MREKKEQNIQIGKQVKKARGNAGLTQEQLAERIEVSPQYISDLERGAVGISILTLKRLCTVLCVTSDQILFPTQPGQDVSVVLDRCKLLSPEQFVLLSDIIEKFVAAIRLERQKEDEPKD